MSDLPNQLNCDPGPFYSGPTLNGEIRPYIAPVVGITSGITFTTYIPNYVNVYSKVYTDYIHENDIVNFFTETTVSMLNNEGMIYRPGLLSRDVWRWDVSGESDYGIIEPPINEPNYDLFDSNWSAQFIVYTKGSNLDFSCRGLGLGNCSHSKTYPRGFSSAPYEFCPAQNVIPSFLPEIKGSSGNVELNIPSRRGASADWKGATASKEPTYLELFNAFNSMNECKYIKTAIGEKYLGCLYSDPSHSSSCGCPEQGAFFGDYLAYSRTMSTFWGTPHNTPLFRNAQIGQLNSEKIMITISGYTEEPVQLGQFIQIDNTNTLPEHDARRSAGYWLVSEITYDFTLDNHYSMILTLIRDATNETHMSSNMGWDPIRRTRRRFSYGVA